MRVHFYKNESPKNVLNKTISELTEKEGTIKKIVNVSQVELLIRIFENWNDFDYIYIPDFKRYYFIEKKDIVNNDLVNIVASVDVLMSFKTTIEKNTLTVSESDKYISGGMGDYDSKNESVLVNSYDFDDVFDGNSGVLITVKGV